MKSLKIFRSVRSVENAVAMEIDLYFIGAGPSSYGITMPPSDTKEEILNNLIRL